MGFEAAAGAAPTIVNSSVARTREYLTAGEIETLMGAARKSSRYGHRDATMILIAFKHGLLCGPVSGVIFNGTRSNSGPADYMSVAASAERQASIQSKVMRSGPCGAFSVNSCRHETGIPELPRLLNVVRGEMSIVGPRLNAGPHNAFSSEAVAAQLVGMLAAVGLSRLLWTNDRDFLQNIE